MLPIDPSEARVRVAFQALEEDDRLANVGWLDHRFTSETVAPTETPIRGNSLAPGGQRTPATQGKIRTAGSINVDLEPEGLTPYLALFQRRARNPVDLGGGAWQHILHPNATDLELRKRRLQVQLFRGDDAIQNSYGVGIGGFQFTANPDQVWAGQVDLVGARTDYWAFPVQTSGTSMAPYLRGYPRIDLWDPLDEGGADVLKVRVTNNAPAVGDLEVAITRDAVPFGANVFPIVAGEWTRVRLSEDGSHIGRAPSHVEILFDDLTGIAIGDEWEVPIRVATPWVQSLPLIDRLSEVETDVRVDGVLVPGVINSIGLTARQTAESSAGVGGVWPQGVSMGGQRQVSWALDKEMVDNRFQRRLDSSTPVHLEVRVRSQVRIGSSGVFYEMRFVSPSCKLSDTRPTVQDADTQREQYNLETGIAALPDAEGFQDDLTIVLTNGLASIV